MNIASWIAGVCHVARPSDELISVSSSCDVITAQHPFANGIGVTDVISSI
jgi:hypothetical protein